MTKRIYLPLSALKRKQATSSKRVKCAKLDNVTLPCMGSVKTQVQEVYDQGSESSCTANAYCNAYRILETDKSFNPSRQYVYWKERLIEDNDQPDKIQDSGANVEDGITYVSKNGVCSETSWPYDSTKTDIAPPDNCDTEAAQHKLGVLQSIDVGNPDDIKASILKGIPVLIAIGIYKSFESFWSSHTGIVKLPTPKNYEDPNDPVDPYQGGHEILIVGYHDVFGGYFTVLNSWGTGWGNRGYCYLPYSYVSNPKLTYQLCCLVKE